MANLGRVRCFLAKGYFCHLKCISGTNQTANITSWDVNSMKGSKYYKDVSIKDAMSVLKQEVNIYKDRLKNACLLNFDINFDIKDGDFENIWKFHDCQTINKWIVTSDEENAEGKSKAYFQLSDNKTGVFHGYLNTESVQDGHYTGYCNIRSPRSYEAIEDVYDFEPFNTLLLKVRGDGRNYLLTIGENKIFDIRHSDLYCYPLYTRGGPYWQTTMIPFSKFFLTSQGRIQDKQEPFDCSRVSYIGISCADNYEGAFHLEIDSIALLYDSSHISGFDYETYKADANIVGT